MLVLSYLTGFHDIVPEATSHQIVFVPIHVYTQMLAKTSFLSIV